MSLLRNTLKASILRQIVKPNQALSSLLPHSPRPFSIEAGLPPPPTQETPAADPFLQTLPSGLVFGRLTGITKYTLKTDIIKLFDGCKLNLDDVKFGYSRFYLPSHVCIRFTSPFCFDAGYKAVSRKGRLYRLEKIDCAEWDLLSPHDGKYLLLEGVPRIAAIGDVERFLSGYEFDSSSINMAFRLPYSQSIKTATVRFPSQIEAMRAAIMKNRCLFFNTQVSVRVLQ